jgi:signal peptidase II
VQRLEFGSPILLIPHLIKLEYTMNHGAVFGLGQGQRPLFLVVSVAAIAFLVYLFATSGHVRIYQVILGMLMAGVLGNMYDRLTLGYVRDMIHGLPGVYWPAWIVNLMPASWQPSRISGRIEVFPWIFNVADSLLCVGVAAMIVYSFISERQRKQTPVAVEEQEK